MKLVCPSEYGVYDSKIFLLFPKTMLKENGGYYHSRHGALIDLCIASEIRGLWEKGVTTYGSCCGHGLGDGMINVGEEDVDTMFLMGYKLVDNIEGNYPHTFIPKSQHKSEHSLN